MREATFDESHDALDGKVQWGEQQVDVVGHHYECVELELALAAVVLKRFEEQSGRS
jgi:hypothetical protein